VLGWVRVCVRFWVWVSFLVRFDWVGFWLGCVLVWVVLVYVSLLMLGWIWFDWVGLGMVRLVWVGLGCVWFIWVGLCWVKDCVVLFWGLCWVGLCMFWVVLI
jgi:hypothetical protein